VPEGGALSVHVAVDAQNLARDDRGIGRYARSVLRRALRDPLFRWTFVVRDWMPNERAIARALGTDRVVVAQRVPRGADVVWFPWNGIFLKGDVPAAATMHDAAPFAFPARDIHLRAVEQTPFLRTAATARKIIVQSQFTAREVQHWLGVERSRLVVTPLGVDAHFRPGPAVAPARLRGKRYVLHVGAHDERKNTNTLIAGFAQAFPKGEVTLVFTKRPKQLPPNALVVEARDDAALLALYRGATAVVVPSTYEGFGLPMLEAMASGAPVLAARAGALPEVGENAVAWIDKPLEAKAWARGLSELLEDDELLREYAALGHARAQLFSWDRCTQQTLDVLTAVAGGA
jgi:glycosyltransferase involved in cell wall biosynthesis